MTPILTSFVFLVLLPVSFWGWGLGFRRLTGNPRGKMSANIALGAAVTILLGGWLNLGGIARPAAVLALLFVGLCLSFLQARGPIFKNLGDETKSIGAGALILSGGFICLLIFTQLPPWAYNPGDDLQKYFTWPTRMLATGSLSFSSTSAIGSESLGGQAFLHGIALAILPADYLTGIDGVFGLGLCLLFALSFSKNAIVQILAVVVVVLIHPQVVNISTLYLGAALIMAILVEAHEAPEPNQPALCGLLYAALLACKSTFALFVLFHVLTAGFSRSSLKSALGAMIRTGLWTLFFLCPWILLHCRHWLDGIGYVPPEVRGASQDIYSSIFSNGPLFYGASLRAYTSLVLCTAIVAGLVAWHTRNSKDPSLKSLTALALLLPLCQLVIYYILGPLLAGQAFIIRYFTPILIALVPFMIGLSLTRLPDTGFRQMAARIGFALPLMLFFPSFAERIEQLISQHNQMAYRTAGSDYFFAASAKAFDGSAKQKLRKAQGIIPAGMPVLACVDTAFLLDFARNPIHDVEIAGVSTPWAKIPAVRYMLLEKHITAASESHYSVMHAPADGIMPDFGLHQRRVASRWLDFHRYMDRLAKQARVIYEDEDLYVFELPEIRESKF